MVMWHSCTELQVLLRLDFHGTAVVRKDELVKKLWEKGDLKANVSVWVHGDGGGGREWERGREEERELGQEYNVSSGDLHNE